MKHLRFLVAILFVLGIASIAVADSVPEAVDPENYPVVWTANVYNGSGSDITSGYIVEWDFRTADSSALDTTWYDDMCPYVQTADAAGDIWTAGVVPYGNGIANGNSGSIIIRGPAYVIEGSTVTEDDIVETDGNGKVQPFGGGATDEGTLGVAIEANSGMTHGPDSGSGWTIIYVNPTQFDEN